MISNETLFKASYKKSSLVFVFFYLEIYFPFMDKFVFPITSFINNLFVFFLKNSIFISYFLNLILFRFCIRLVLFFSSKNSSFSVYCLNIVFSLSKTKKILNIVNNKIVDKIEYLKGTLNMMHRYFVSFKTKFIIDNLSLYRYPNESNLVEFIGIIKYVNFVFYKINRNLDSLINLNYGIEKNLYEDKNIADILVNKNFIYSKLSVFQRPNLSYIFKLIVANLTTFLLLLVAIPIYNLFCLPIFTYVINLMFGLVLSLLDFVKVFFNIFFKKNFNYKNYKTSLNYNSIFYYVYLIFFKFKKILKVLNLRKFIRRLNSYVCNNILSSYWDESKQPDQCSRWIKFNIFSGMKRLNNGFVDLSLKDRNSNVLEIEIIAPNSVSERISDAVSPYSGKNLLSDDAEEYSYLLTNEIERSYERVDAFIDFLYKYFVFNKIISNVIILPFISFITLFCKTCTDFYLFCFIQSRRVLHYILNTDADIVATTSNPIMKVLADNMTILLYNLYHAFRIKFLYYFAFMYLLYDNLFCLDGVVYVGNTNFGITWLHSPVIMGFFFLVMIVRWLHRLISTDHNKITFGYLQYEKVVETRHDKDVDDLSYRYSVLPTILLATYYSSYLLLNASINQPHLIREDVFDRVKKVWGNYSKDYNDVSTEPLQQVSSDLIGLIIHYSQFPLRELYKLLF